jgi:1-acyl-sn-glycerol-3-phosphate acyltransferase
MAGPRVPALPPSAPSRESTAARAVGRIALRMLGWRIDGAVPDVPRCLVVVAPHTSNWDFVAGLAAALALGLRIQYLGKHTIFRWPFRALLRWSGGIPVDRGAPGDISERAAAAMRAADRMFLALSPEGTRHKVERWKTGFHRIALAAGVPIFPVALDYASRTVRLLPLFVPGADAAADIGRLRSLYAPTMARHPDSF